MKKKQNRRSNEKYPGLKRHFTLKTRQDYFEADYVDGVLNDDGEMVIRPLNEVEKDWLNRFNEEFVSANMLHDKELKKLYDEIKLLEIIKRPNEEQKEYHMYLKFMYEARADEVQLHRSGKDQRKIFSANNSRKRCVLNDAKSSGRLYEFKEEIYNEDEEE